MRVYQISPLKVMQNRCGMRRFDKHRVEPSPPQTAQAAEMEARLAGFRAERDQMLTGGSSRTEIKPTEDLKPSDTATGYTPWRTPSVIVSGHSASSRFASSRFASSRFALGRIQ